MPVPNPKIAFYQNTLLLMTKFYVYFQNMVGPKPKPVRPKSAKTVFEKPSEGKLSKKSKKPVVKAVEAKVAVSKKSAKTAPAVKDAPVKKDEVKRIEKKEVVEIKLEQVYLFILRSPSKF